MKQIYASGTITADARGTDTPLPGRGSRLPAVKASTGGLNAEHLHAVLPHAVYPATSRNADSGRPLPVRLALLKTTSGRVLTHATPGDGSYFTHTLLNVPDTADAQLAIQTWGSPLWQRSAPESAADLPELPYLPVADTLDDAALKTWLAAPDKRELLEFTLTALLGRPATERVVLAAPADDVATVIFAVTRSLPANLLDDFTFSTFEADPLASTARLVGHDAGADGPDLPDECYRRGAALNTHTGKRSDLKTEVPFAAVAAKALADGDRAQLDDLKGTWQRLGLKDAAQFDLVFRLARGTGTLTKAEAAESLRHPPLAAWIAARPDVLNQFLEWALDDREFANQSLVRAVQSLRQKPDVLAKLAAAAREAGLKALAAGDKDRTGTAFEVILPMAAPAKANGVWNDLLVQASDPTTLPWEMRWYLLPRFVRFKQPQTAAVDPAFARWLDVPAERLGELLALDLPKAYQLEAGRAALRRDGEPTAALVHTLAAHPPLVLTLLQPADGEERAARLYQALLTDAPSAPWFERVIEHAADYPKPLLNRFFEATLARNTLDADRLVRTQGTRLLELFDGQSGLDQLGLQFLAVPPADVLNNDTVLGFLGKLREQAGIGDELKTRIDAVTAVRAYLDAPQFTEAAMAPVTAAFAVTPTALPPAAKQAVFDAVAGEVAKRSGQSNLQTDLEAALAHFGGTLANDPTDLFENLLRDLRTRTPEFGRQATAVHAVLAVALGATESAELAGKLDGLDGHAFAVASDAAKSGGNRLLDEIDSRSQAWPKEARTKWGFLLAAVRPKSRWQRDVVCGLIGAAVAAAGFAAWTLLR